MIRNQRAVFKLPESYGVDRLVALPCDYRTIFTFWEISEESWAKSGAQLHLKVNLISNNHDDSQDITCINEIPLFERTGSLYLKVPAGESVYVEINEVGLVSNTVFVPRPFDAKSSIIIHAYALSP